MEGNRNCALTRGPSTNAPTTPGRRLQGIAPRTCRGSEPRHDPASRLSEGAVILRVSFPDREGFRSTGQSRESGRVPEPSDSHLCEGRLTPGVRGFRGICGIWVLGFCAVLAPPAMAQAVDSSGRDLSTLDIEELARIKVTSVTGRREAVAQASAAVAVISREDIRRSGAAGGRDRVPLQAVRSPESHPYRAGGAGQRANWTRGGAGYRAFTGLSDLRSDL
jgi:hypothetical protein